MRKAQITVVLWFQLFRALIAVFLIIAAINFCTKNTDAYEENFDKASELISSVAGQNSNYKVSDLFVFEPERQMGVFFRGEPEFNYVAQYVESCWLKTVKVATRDERGKEISSYQKFNPENNCVIPRKGAILIERPSTCGLNGCFCIFTGVSVSQQSFQNPDGSQLDFDGTKIDKYQKVSYDTLRCKNIESPPASKQIIFSEKEVFTVTSGLLGVDGLKLGYKTQEIINIGGTIMAPINSEAQLFYFSNKPQDNGFVVCKFEDEC